MFHYTIVTFVAYIGMRFIFNAMWNIIGYKDNNTL
jgi:hypothetical protein